MALEHLLTLCAGRSKVTSAPSLIDFCPLSRGNEVLTYYICCLRWRGLLVVPSFKYGLEPLEPEANSSVVNSQSILARHAYCSGPPPQAATSLSRICLLEIAAAQTLPRQNAKFGLRDVRPTHMFGVERHSNRGRT
jgi:hypothetical protein